MAAIVDQTVLEERLMALEAARTWSPRVVSRLEAHIRTADDYALFRINPLRYAAEHGVGRPRRSISSSTRSGRGFSTWTGLSCAPSAATCSPACAASSGSIRTSAAICSASGTRPRSTIRSRSRSPCPRSLDTRPTAWGPTVPELLRSITRYLGCLEPTDTLRTEIEASGIQIAIRDVLHGATAVYRSGSAAGRGGIELDLRPGGFVDRAQDLAPFGYELPAVGGFEFTASGECRRRAL